MAQYCFTHFSSKYEFQTLTSDIIHFKVGDIPLVAIHSEARDRSPRREKETDDLQSKGTNKHSDKTISVKNEIKGEEPMQILKNKKEDPVKQGLEDLQRVLPHLGSPGEEKVSDDKLKGFINAST